VLLVFAVVLSSGCGFGGDDASVQRLDLPRIVLQQADVPASYRPVASGAAESGGWFARYRAPNGQLVESRVELFVSADDATDGLGAAREELAEATREWQPIDEPGLGQESFAATLVDGQVRSYRVVWRAWNVRASLDVDGPELTLPLSDVLALARAQDERISAAAS
jgi:hypothetical protein